MRQTIFGLVAAVAVVTASAAPALACGGGLFGSSCAPCGGAFTSCAEGYDRPAHHGAAAYERLPGPQYFYANQGPSFSGPGMFAPVPTYQESAVSGWGAYNHDYYYGYDGGRYANATNHYYDGAPAAEGPVVYSYRAHPHFRPWHGRTGYYSYAPRYHAWTRHTLRYGYVPHQGMRYVAAPRNAGHRRYN
jgi:hypothetical protein